MWGVDDDVERLLLPGPERVVIGLPGVEMTAEGGRRLVGLKYEGGVDDDAQLIVGCPVRGDLDNIVPGDGQRSTPEGLPCGPAFDGGSRRCLNPETDALLLGRDADVHYLPSQRAQGIALHFVRSEVTVEAL